MLTLINKNGQVQPVCQIGRSADISTVGDCGSVYRGLIRVKAVGGDARISTGNLMAYFSDPGVLLVENETEYFIIPDNDTLYLVSGEINVMY